MWFELDRKMVLLAPMDGYTDPPFRRFIKTVAPDAVVFSEFLSAKNVFAKPKLADSLFVVYPDEFPVVIQLYGKEPRHFALAAHLAEERGAMGIDINMGCPAKKVVAHQHGSALMKNIDLACEIVAAVKRAVKVPVSVKTRLGWDDESKLIPFVRQLVDAGLDAITVHGRTYRQRFEGEANYQPIYDLKNAVSIPVFGNGDIDSVDKAQRRLGNLNGLMIGRAAVTDPWLMRDLCDVLHLGMRPQARRFEDKVGLWKRFAELAVSGGVELYACRAFRKYLCKLVRELGVPEIRKDAVRVETLTQIHGVLDQLADATVAEQVA